MNYLDMFLLEISEKDQKNIKIASSSVGAVGGGVKGGIAGSAIGGGVYFLRKRNAFKKCQALGDPEKIQQCKAEVNKKFSLLKHVGGGAAAGGAVGAGTGAAVGYSFGNYAGKLIKRASDEHDKDVKEDHDEINRIKRGRFFRDIGR